MNFFKILKYFLICFITFIFEMTVGKFLAISGTVPMISYCLCMVISAKENKENYIIYTNIAVGAMLDLLVGHGFGSYTIIFILSSFVTYLLRDSIFSSKLLFLVIDTFILTIISSVIYYLFHILNVGMNFGTMLVNFAVPTAIYNVFVCIFIYFILSFTLYKRR